MIALFLAGLLAADGSRAFAPARLGPEPVRPYVDLGPVSLPSNIDKRSVFDKALQLEGDRLKADGFFVSRGDPLALYAPGTTSAPLWSPSMGPAMVVPMAIVALISNDEPHRPVVLRAYTFRDLPAKTRQRLLEASRQVVLGELSVADFEAERERLARGES